MSTSATILLNNIQAREHTTSFVSTFSEEGGNTRSPCKKRGGDPAQEVTFTQVFFEVLEISASHLTELFFFLQFVFTLQDMLTTKGTWRRLWIKHLDKFQIAERCFSRSTNMRRLVDNERFPGAPARCPHSSTSSGRRIFH